MIRRETKKNILDHFNMEGIKFSGRMSDIDFLSRLYDLKKLPSHDNRYEDALGDVWQHTENNADLQGNWVFDDERFLPANDSDEVFLRFVCEMAHPLVRPDLQEASKVLSITNDWLKEDGWELYPVKDIAGGKILSYRSTLPIQKPKEEELVHIWDRNKLRLFISHRDTHKIEVKKFSDDLKVYGVSGFVAHESIPEQSFWREEILKGLRSMDACLCYITDDFYESIWTNQEIGYAMAKGVPIYLYKAQKTDPKGFLSEVQAIKTGLPGLLSKIKEHFSGNTNFKRSYIDRFLEASDTSFDTAKNRFFDLVGLRFNDSEIEEIVRAIAPASVGNGNVNKLNAILQDHVKDEHKEHPLLRNYIQYNEYLTNNIIAYHSRKTFSFKKLANKSWGYDVIEGTKR